jgi:hypothetical protein
VTETRWRIITEKSVIGADENRGTIMQMVRIQIPDRDECSKAFAALIRRGRVDCYPDNTFIISELGLQLLQELGVSYVELGRGGMD